MSNTKSSNWIVELDYSADPESEAFEVRERVATEIGAATTRIGDILTIPAAQAMSVLFQFSEHIVSIEKA
jgi:hypothetical protein